MRKKLLLLLIPLLALSIFSQLHLNMMKVSACVSPYIAVVPESTINETLTSGMNYTISICTDYAGDDVWGYEFTLTYNSSVLEGVEVVNGDLITEETGTTMFASAGFNNTAGELKLTGNGFFVMPGEPMPVTSGPGTLANITFTVVGYGTSNITLGDETILIGYNATAGGEYNIIHAAMPNHIQHGYFSNKIPGDIDGDGDVDPDDFVTFAGAYGTKEGDPAYNPEADLDHDGDVDPDDFVTFAGKYGTSV